MPTNLPPEYFDAEDRYKAACSPQEKISRLEELISTIPKHKGTDKLRADLRRRLSKLKSASETKKGATRHVSAFQIDKEGAAQVPVIGPANVGKSELVTALTNASPEVADFPHTTWTVTPGMMFVGHAPIQLIDTPPLCREYIEPALMDLIRRADLMLLVIDIQTDPIGQLEETVALLQENRITPLRQKGLNDGEQHLYVLPFLVAVNQYDDDQYSEDYAIMQELLSGDWPLIPISARTGYNLDLLQQTVFEQLDLMRVYTQSPGSVADRTKPYVIKKGSTVEDLAAKVHHDFFEQLKCARIWGSGAFQGQMVGRDHELREGDVVELRI